MHIANSVITRLTQDLASTRSKAIYSARALRKLHVRQARCSTQITTLLGVLAVTLLSGCEFKLVTPFEANAGEDFTVDVGASPTFDGCASIGEIVNYKWVIIKAPENMSEYDGKVIREIDPNCSFTLEASMLADEAGEWEIELEITGANGNTSTDTVMVIVAA